MLLHEYLGLLLFNIDTTECLASSQLHADCSMTPSVRADVVIRSKAAMSSLKRLQTSPWHKAFLGMIPRVHTSKNVQMDWSCDALSERELSEAAALCSCLGLGQLSKLYK